MCLITLDYTEWCSFQGGIINKEEEGEGCSRNIIISLNCTPMPIALISSYLQAGNTPDKIATYEMVLDEI